FYPYRASLCSARMRKMQRPMRLHPKYIVAIQQPVQLLAAQRYDCLARAMRPGELLTLQALVPDDETRGIPRQDLQLVALTVDEHEQRTGKRIQPQHAFDQRRQAVHLLAHVD